MSDPKPDELWLIHDTSTNQLIDSAICAVEGFANEDIAQDCIYAGGGDGEPMRHCTPVRVLPPPDTLAALLADERWDNSWTVHGGKFRVDAGTPLWNVRDHYGVAITVWHPTPEAAVRAALETKGGA